MPDLSHLSDAELMNLYKSSSVSKMSDEELKAAYEGANKPSMLQSLFSSTPSDKLTPEEQASQEKQASEAAKDPAGQAQSAREASAKTLKRGVAPLHPELGSDLPQRMSSGAAGPLALATLGAVAPIGPILGAAGKLLPVGDLAKAGTAATVSYGLDALSKSDLLPSYLKAAAHGGSKVLDWYTGAKMFHRAEGAGQAAKAASNVGSTAAKSVGEAERMSSALKYPPNLAPGTTVRPQPPTTIPQRVLPKSGTSGTPLPVEAPTPSIPKKIQIQPKTGRPKEELEALLKALKKKE